MAVKPRAGHRLLGHEIASHALLSCFSIQYMLSFSLPRFHSVQLHWRLVSWFSAELLWNSGSQNWLPARWGRDAVAPYSALSIGCSAGKVGKPGNQAPPHALGSKKLSPGTKGRREARKLNTQHPVLLLCFSLVFMGILRGASFR